MQNEIAFTKMHGLGNDFVIMTNFEQQLQLTPALIRRLSHRRTGIGFDQLLLIEPSEQVDFHYRIFNADGQEVEQCGNGARCIAKFLHNKGLTNKKNLQLSSMNEHISAKLLPNGEVCVILEKPREILTKQTIHTVPPQQASIVQLSNPHAVLQVSHCESADVEKIGSEIAAHKTFPEGINVGFMQIIDRQEIKLRVYERGAGETLACGTGACAAMVAGRYQDLLDKSVKVRLPGGTLQIEWPGDEATISVTGQAMLVYDGQLVLG